MSATGCSYAQAVRRQTTASAAAPAATLNTSATASHEDKDSDIPNAASQTLSLNASSSLPTDTAKAPAKASANDASPSPRKLASEAPPSPATSSTLIGTTAESASSFSLDEGSSHLASADKPSRVTTPGTRSPPSDDLPRKAGRRSKATAKTADMDASAQAATAAGDAENETEVDAPKVELTPAPVPAVNIWSKRMMEQAAKVKPTAAPAKLPSTTISRPVAPAPPSSNSNANANGTKGKDSKKAAVASAGADSTDANGTHSAAGKAANRRPNESPRSGTDQLRRSGPRSARSADKDEKQTITHRDALPSVNDATSWPTPESSVAADDSRSKTATDKPELTDKETLDESGSLKSRKKGWVHMPFVPTVNFQTPIPNARGSKPKPSARGTREPSSRNGHSNTTNSTAPAEKAASASASPVDSKQDADARLSAKEVNSTSLPNRPSTQTAAPHKRFPADATHGHSRESRKPLTTSLPEKPKDTAADQQPGAGKSDHGPKVAQATNINGDSNAQSHQATHHAHERRPPFASKNGNHHAPLGKEFTPQEHKEHHLHNPRERTEQRGDRTGRGGFRSGRGGGLAQNQHLGHPYQGNGQRMAPNTSHGSSSTLPPTAAPFTPPSQQHLPSQQFSYGGANSATRPGGRVPARSQAGSQPPLSYGGRPQHGNHRTYMHASHGASAAPTEYQTQPFSFPSFNPYMDTELLHGLTLQVEYYFSLDNLCKDVFLRKKMNDQGFVPLSTIAKFKRMSDLAPSLDFIRAACEQSENLDYVVDQEQNEWIRSRQLWGGFVLPPDERDDEARKPGPDLRSVLFRSAHSRPQQPYAHSVMASGYQPVQQAMFPHAAYPINGQEMMFNAGHSNYADYAAQASSSGGELIGRSLRAGDSQLSASVPDFSPGGAGRGSGAPMTLEDYQTYPDEQVEKLVVLVRSDPEQAPVEALKAASTDASRHKDHPHQNGSSSANGISKETSPQNGTLLDKAASDARASSQTVGEEPYPELRAKALEQRALVKTVETPGAMMHLYRFWSHCLPDKFNVRMYEDFRSLALEDARSTPSLDFGLKCLVQYYNQVLFSSSNARPYPAVFVPHHAEARKLLDLSKPKANNANGESRG